MSAVFDSLGGALQPVPLSSPAPAPARHAQEFSTALPGERTHVGHRGRQSKGRGTGLAIVVGIHVLIGWALTSGLAQHVVNLVRKPIQMSIIDDTPPPPPPPPPPKVEKIREAPKVATPPPAYVPPPEVVPSPAPAAPTITATQAEPPREPAVVAPPAPPAPPPAPPAVAKVEASVACPGYQNVLSQALEDAFDRVGIAGTVLIRLTVHGTQVTDVAAVSGPKEYYKYVQTAVKRLRCSAGGADEVQVMVPFNFSK